MEQSLEKIKERGGSGIGSAFTRRRLESDPYQREGDSIHTPG
jgi:hypothetical protein